MPQTATCTATKKNFEVSDLEISIRKKFGFEDLPKLSPEFRFMQLGAFWPHWNLHPRKCDKTGKNIISVYRENCDYPVWHRDIWNESSDPPMAEFDASKNFFPQAWDLFQKSPIPHNSGLGNQNSDYTDDMWYSKNCYLCHSGVRNEDLKYCYRSYEMKDTLFSTFSFYSELCIDVANCFHCFELKHGVNSRNCQDSAFLYDCRNCNHCMLCWNLRNKEYCFMNEQLTKEAYQEKLKEWNLASRVVYDKAKKEFLTIMTKKAWHRALSIDKCENTTGNYVDSSKNALNCYFIDNAEDCVNSIRGGHGQKDTVDTLCGTESELSLGTTLVGNSYNCTYSFQLIQCRFLDYSAFCERCENCFGCCGLVGKKFHIFNKPYSEAEYKTKREEIIAHMKNTGEWGQFFPGHFAPNPYDESWSSFPFPIDHAKQKQYGFRVAEPIEKRSQNCSNPSEIPDSFEGLSDDDIEALTQKIFWDEKAQRRFSITKADVDFCKKMHVALPNCYYVNRMQEVFRWLPFSGSLRETTCGKSGKRIETTWPAALDGRILSEEEYLAMIG